VTKLQNTINDDNIVTTIIRTAVVDITALTFSEKNKEEHPKQLL